MSEKKRYFSGQKVPLLDPRSAAFCPEKHRFSSGYWSFVKIFRNELVVAKP